MTAQQFALAVRADQKWVQNAARLLRRRFQYTPEEARWLGLVRLLHQGVGSPLKLAAKMAYTAMALRPWKRAGRIASVPARGTHAEAFVVVDLARYHTSFAASLSRALVHETPRRRGRRSAVRKRHPRQVLVAARKRGVKTGLLEAALVLTPAERLAQLRIGPMLQGLSRARVAFVVVGGVAASAHGSASVSAVLDICYKPVPDNVRRLARLLAEWHSYPRAIERGLPFIMDATTLRTSPVLTLGTTNGLINVLDRIEGIGNYSAVKKQSEIIGAFGIRFRAINLPTLISANRAAGRTEDFAQLPELEALLALWVLRQTQSQRLRLTFDRTRQNRCIRASDRSPVTPP